MPNIRVLPPAAGGLTTVNGRTYTCAAGASIDVPDFDAKVLSANGWIITSPAGVGGTSARPLNPKQGDHFVDTDLASISIRFDGKVWRNNSTGAAV